MIMKIIICFFLACLLFSCNNDTTSVVQDSKRTNMLLPTSVGISYSFPFDSVTMPDWQKNLKPYSFLGNLFNKAIGSGVTVYEPAFSQNSLIKCNPDDILRRMQQENTVSNIHEIKALFFTEEWFLDTCKPFLFEKNVNCWFPVRYYSDSVTDKKTLVFKVAGGNPEILLAENVIYEVMLYDSLNPDFTSALNPARLSKLLVETALSGNIKAYNPLNINLQLTKNEILLKAGVSETGFSAEEGANSSISNSSLYQEMVYEEIKSIVFIEDWYYDPSTYAIRKKINGIAPVRHYAKTDETVKSVLFLIFLNSKKTPLFKI